MKPVRWLCRNPKLGFSAHSANPWVLRHKHHGNSGPVSRINMIMDKSMERVPGSRFVFHVSNRRSSVLTPAEELKYYAGAGVNPSDRGICIYLLL